QRVEAINASSPMTKRLAPRRFDAKDLKDSTLVAEPTFGIDDESVRGMVGVGRIDAVHDSDRHIGTVIAIGVFKKQQVRRLRDKDTAAPKFKAGRVMQVIGERNTLVGNAVAIVVLKNEE